MLALLHSVPPTADPRLYWGLLDTHGQVLVSLLWHHCSFLLGPGVHKVLFVPSRFCLCPQGFVCDQPRQHIKKQRHYFAYKVCIVKAMLWVFFFFFFFSVVMYGYECWTLKKVDCWRIDAFNCGAGEDSWESLGQQEDQTSQSWRKSILNIHWKDWCWSWNSNTLATLCKELTHWKRPWCWERMRAGEEGDR